MDILKNNIINIHHTIIIPQNSNEVNIYAAEELAKYLNKITTITYIIKTDDDAILNLLNQNNQNFISVGNTKLSEKLKYYYTHENKEGFRIVTSNNNIFILGNNRGLLYGVYSFLENYLGVKYFTPEIEIIPNKENIFIDDNIDYTYKPNMEYREPYISEMKNPDFAAKSKVNGQGVELCKKHGDKVDYAKDYFVHTFTKLFPIEEYFESHPEYYSLINGERQKEKTQLCLTNKEVLELTIQKVKQIIKLNPEANIISISQDDNYNGCTCENCKKIDEYEESQAGSLIYFLNEVAKAIEDEYPNIIIDTLAYQYTRKPPKHVKVHKQICVRLCTIECCFIHPLSNCHVDDPDAPKLEFSNSFSEDLIGWGKISQRLYIWDYVTNFSHYWMPHPNFSVLAENIKFFAENNVKGVFEQGCPAIGGGEMTDLRGYILAKCLWDNNYDANLAMDEFLSGVYGVAGVYIKKYLDTVYNYVISKNCHLYCFNHPNKPWHTMELVEKCKDIFKQALMISANEEIYNRVKKQSLAVDYLRILLTKKGSTQREKLICEFEFNVKKFNITHIWEREDVEFCLAVLKGEKEPGYWWEN